MQTRKAHDAQKLAEKEQAGGPGGAGYKGPDGSGQWISMGELDPTEDLDQALDSLTGGTSLISPFLWRHSACICLCFLLSSCGTASAQ